jgi:hypothetical protein
MAEQIGFQYYFKVTPHGGSAVDLSDHVEELSIKRTVKEEAYVESNVGGTTVFQKRLMGMQDFVVTVKFADDYASGSVHSTLSAAFGQPCTIVAALNGATPSATNEVWTDVVTFPELTSGGPAGSRLEKSITFSHASGTPTAAVS